MHLWNTRPALLLARALLACGPLLALAPPALAHDVYPEQRCVLGWVPYWDQERAIASFRENVTLFDTVAFFWYYLGKDGEIETYDRSRIDRDTIEFAREHGVKTLAIVTNLPMSGREHWEPKRVGRMTASRKARAQHVADLVALSEDLGVDGINIDYEALPRRQRDDFSRFVRELGEALHARGKILAVALHPKTSEGNPRDANGSEAQDWEALHPWVDQMHLMTYGETGSERPGPSGPNASPAWISSVLHYALHVRQVPLDKIYLGLPLYAESWSEVKPSRYRMDGLDLTWADVVRIEERYEVERHWDERSSTPYLDYRDRNDRSRVIWFEDARSIATKLELRERFGVCKVALWRLGGEDPGVWSQLEIPEPEARVSSSEAEPPTSSGALE
jgi:spore germination protein YaaH